MLDPGSRRHPAEQGAPPRLAQPALRPADEGGVDVVRGDGGADRVKVGLARTTRLEKSAEFQPGLDE
jgi:hypothetical protein